MPHRVPLFPALSAQHHALATQALDADKHCFVEKPLSLTYDEGAALVRLAETKKKILFVGRTLSKKSKHSLPDLCYSKKRQRSGRMTLEKAQPRDRQKDAAKTLTLKT